MADLKLNTANGSINYNYDSGGYGYGSITVTGQER